MDWLLALYTVGDHRVSMKNELSTLGNLNYIFPNPKPQTPNPKPLMPKIPRTIILKNLLSLSYPLISCYDTDKIKYLKMRNVVRAIKIPYGSHGRKGSLL